MPKETRFQNQKELNRRTFPVNVNNQLPFNSKRVLKCKGVRPLLSLSQQTLFKKMVIIISKKI